jgi:BirA family transcriptional regulator, biotin operon repressor / biotin---[acetyl-CoA-carboxylase] ligase
MVLSLPADLEPPHVLRHLAATRIGRTYDAVHLCESTNDLVARRAREGAPEGLLVVADAQSAGRGRQGRSWHSPPRENLTFSLLLRPDRPAAALPPLTLLTGVVLARVLTMLGVSPRLKWPNDLVVDLEGKPRKLVGILTEMATERDRIKHVVVGVGVNVNTTAFPPELADRATSLRALTGRVHDRGVLLAAIASAFEPAYDKALAIGPTSFLPAWRTFAGLPRPCRIDRPGGTLEGTALDVDEVGALLVRDGAGQSHRVFSGELVGPWS